MKNVGRIFKITALLPWLILFFLFFTGCSDRGPHRGPPVKSASPHSPVPETGLPVPGGWRELPERHYDDDPYIYNAKNRLIPKNIREIENTTDGLAREEKFIREKLKSNPENFDYLYLLAYNQFDREKYDSARRLFDRVLKIDPDQERAVEGRAYCFYKKEDYSTARKAAREAVKKYPDNPRLLHVLAGSYLYGYRDPDRAVKIYKRAINLDPKDPRLWLGLAEAYVEMKTPKASGKAIKVMEETIRRFPDYHIVYILLAEELHLQGRFRESLVRLEEAISRDPRYYRSYSIIGDIFHELDNKEQAQKFYGRTLKTNPRYEALIYIKSGRLYREMGDPDTARKYFDRAVNLHRETGDTEPNQEVALARVETALLLIDQGKIKKAEQALKMAQKDYPQLEQLGYGQGMLHLARGEWDKAEATLKNSRKPDSTENSLDEWQVSYGLARVTAARGNEQKSLKYLKEALSLLPSYRKIYLDSLARHDRYLLKITNLPGYKPVRKQVDRLREKSKDIKPKERYVD